MPELTETQKEVIKKRRGYICDRDKRRHRSRSLVIHHKDRDRKNNNPRNLRVLCAPHHRDLHKRARW